jgi:propionyl-CoA synthetase
MGWPVTGTAVGLKRLLDAKDQKSPIFPSSKIGSCGLPIPGANLQVLVPDADMVDHDENHDKKWKSVNANVLGNIALKLPLAPGAFKALSNDEDGKRMFNGYYKRIPGLFDTADAGLIDEDGFVSVMGRVDDVINVAGHRISTGALEACISTNRCVAECCVIGIKDELKGQRPLAFVVLKSNTGTDESHRLADDLRNLIRHDIGPIATIRTSEIFFVPNLPKTRSGKILRKSLRNIVNHEHVMIPPTIEDIKVLDYIQKLFSEKHPISTAA